MVRRVFLTLVLSSLLLGASPVEAVIHNITIGNNFFLPLGTRVAPGDTVRWTWVGGFLHNTTSDPGSPKTWASMTTSAGGFIFEEVFTPADGPGPFPYRCTVHPFTMIDTIHMDIPAEPIMFAFRLDSKQAASCAGSGTGEGGYGLAILSPDSTNLSLHLYHNASSPTLADIHRGAPCVSGPILFQFADPVSPVAETWALSLADVADLMAGDLYVDIHSSPGFSENLRGQIVQAPVNFIYQIDESQAEQGAGTGSLANGLGIGTLSGDGLTFTSTISHNVTNVTEAHIHFAAPGVGGPIQFGFADPVNIADEIWSLDTTDIMNLLAGNLYANIHSLAFLPGEIRGQIVPTGGSFVANLDGDQAGTGSDSTGFCVITLSPDQCTFTIHCEHNVANVIDAHIHLGAPGVGGPIQFGLGSPVSPIDTSWTLTPADLQNFIDGNLYVNVHSAAFPAGEIRGQILPFGRQTFSFGLDESQLNNCAGSGSTATGNATVELSPGGHRMTIEVSHNVVDAIDGHVHLAPVCVGGMSIFSFSSPLSPIEEIWLPRTVDIVSLMQKQLYLNVHSLALLDGEIRGQIENPSGCCVGSTGNIDNDIADITDIADLTFLIDHLFINFPPLDCPAEGNIDGDIAGIVDIADLTFLIDHLFINFPPTAVCQ